MPRKSMSRALRFEIFKRDGFRCVYCGADPQQSILHVDHVDAVSTGGTNDPHNLVTSCADCNGGKSNIPLEQRRLAPTMSTADAQEHAQQLKAYLAAQREITAAKKGFLDDVEAHWTDAVGWSFSAQERPSVARFLAQLGFESVIAAVNIAAARLPARSEYQASKTFAYFCGICWRNIRDREAAAEPRAVAAADVDPGNDGGSDESEEDDEPDEYAWGEAGWGDTMDPRTVADVAQLLSIRPVIVVVNPLDPNIISPTRLEANVGSHHGFPICYEPTKKPQDVFLDQEAFRCVTTNAESGQQALVSIPWRAIRYLWTRNGDAEAVYFNLWPRSHFAQLTDELLVPQPEAAT